MLYAYIAMLPNSNGIKFKKVAIIGDTSDDDAVEVKSSQSIYWESSPIRSAKTQPSGPSFAHLISTKSEYLKHLLDWAQD
jgi:hypothetical protein